MAEKEFTDVEIASCAPRAFFSHRQTVEGNVQKVGGLCMKEKNRARILKPPGCYFVLVVLEQEVVVFS